MKSDDVSNLLLLAPLVFTTHFVEEAPGFVSWFNAHATARGITTESFWTVNLIGLVITLVLVILYRTEPSAFALLLTVCWLSFLMPANALLHITGAVIDRNYVPGVVTAVVLYLPYYFWLVLRIVTARKLSAGLLCGVAVLGSIPMLIHGYRILFLGDRLF